jgi:hypothetical protein
VARLRGDAQQLRRRWLGCANSLPGAPPAAREPDATAIERADSAARIVLAADQCDAQVRALQDLLRAEREERNK